MGYRQHNQPDHIYVHGKGDLEQEALRRQRNINYVIRVVMSSFLVTFSLFRRIHNWFYPSDEEVIALGRDIDEHGQEGDVVGIPSQLLRHHLHVLGGTGRGKTTLLINMIIQLMVMRRSLIIIDVKGDLIDTIVQFIPPDRVEDVILFDPCDTKYPLAWNIFQLGKKEDKSRLAGEIVLVIHKLVGDSWGPRLESLLRNSALALLDFPGSTFLDLYYFFIDEAFRNTVIPKITDVFVREFWEKTFPAWSASQQAIAINPVLNKLEPFLSHEVFRQYLGQPNSSFSLREVMDSGKILLVRIPQGILGKDLSSIIGGLFIAKLHMEILSRQDTPIEKRRPTVFIADEFQEIASESFEQTLSLARSYNVACIAANQFSGQLPTLLAQALDHNCAVRLTGHLEGNRHLVEFDLLQDIDQPKFFIRPLLPATGPSAEVAKSVRTMSQMRYGTELADVQQQLHLRHMRRTQYAAEYQAEKQQKEEAQKQGKQSQNTTKPKPVQQSKPITPGMTTSPQTQQPQPRTPGARKPTVMQHGTQQQQKPPTTTQQGAQKRRPKNGGNTA